jgi:hypothetical protein
MNETKEFRQALKMTGIVVNEAACELFIKVYRSYSELGGEYSLRDAARIMAEVKEHYPNGLLSVETNTL